MMMTVQKLRRWRLITVLILAAGLGLMPVAADAAAKDKPSDDTQLSDVLDGFEDQDNVDDDALSGFEETKPAAAPKAQKKEKPPSIWELDGHLKLAGAYNFAHDAPAANQSDWRGLSRLRTELQTYLSLKPNKRWQMYGGFSAFYDWVYTIRDRDNFTGNVVSEYETEIELRELYLQGRISDHLDIKIGRQIMVWGKSDNVRVTDVINPLDMREPSVTDIADLRLPVTMTRIDYYLGPISVTGIAVHEVRFNKNPVFGSDFYPGVTAPPTEVEPSSSIDNTQYGLALNGVFSGWDAALYFADFYDPNTHYTRVGATLPPVFNRRHARLKMYGAAANLALGNWLIKGEAAYLNGFRFLNGPDKDYARIDALIGFEYSGFTDTTISFEAVNRAMIDYDQALAQTPDFAEASEFQSVIRISRTFINETLTVTLLASYYGLTGQGGALQRIGAEYDLNDAITLSGGAVFYQSGNIARLKNIGDNDRLYFEIKYSF